MAQRYHKKKLPQSNNCLICSESFDEERYPVAPECGHVLCCKCYALTKSKCPFCRRPSNESIRLYNDAETDSLASDIQNLSIEPDIQELSSMLLCTKNTEIRKLNQDKYRWNNIKINVTPLRGNPYCLTVKESDTVASLKVKIKGREGVPESGVTIYLNDFLFQS